MKTFKDLEFTHNRYPLGIMGVELFFDNGYGISVLSGERGLRTCTHRDNDYKVTILNKASPYYGSRTVDRILGFCNKAKVTKIMKQIQELKKLNDGKTNTPKVKRYEARYDNSIRRWIVPGTP